MKIPVTLAIDYGTKRIGLARSFGTLAEPLEVLPNRPDWLDKLKQIVATEGIEQIVVGVSENEMAAQSQAIGEKVRAELGLPVHFFDETLSSKTVERQLKETGRIRPGFRSVVDHLAAASFLQEWLDTQPLT